MMKLRNLILATSGAYMVSVLAGCGAATAQDANACYPVLICPDPSSAGTGGSVAGTGGAAGSVAGTGASGSGGQGGTASGSLTATDVQLSTTTVAAGSTLNGSVTYKNGTSSSITLSQVVIALRAPGGSHSGGPYTDMAPAKTNLVIPAGQSATVTASRAFTSSDTTGKWEAYATSQQGTTWTDAAPSVYFTVTSGSGGTGGTGASGSGGAAGGVVAGSGGTGGSGGSGSLPTSLKVGVNTWYLQPGWGYGTPYKSGINWATAYSTGANIWNDAFIADLAPFSSLRLMDWNGTNHSKVTSWSQRRQPTDTGNASIYVDQSTGVVPGLAYEWQFDLCKRSNKVCWITLPAQANDDYLVQFAKLVKDKLDPKVTLIVEYSNEIDGGWFTQTNYAYSQGAALGLPGDNKYYQGGSWATYRTLQIRKALQDQLGSEVGSRILVGRCGVGNTDIMKQSLTTVYKSTKWNPTGQKIDLLCTSAYFGNGKDGNSYTLAQAKTDIDTLVNSTDGFKNMKSAATNAGIPMLAVYEGGVHVLVNAGTFSAKPEAGQAMTYLLDSSAPYVTWFNLYTDSSTWPNNSGSGAWGLKQQIGGAETVKSTAVKAWISSHANRSVARHDSVTDDSSDKGLSGGQIAGLILLLGLVAAVGVFWWVKKSKSKD